MQRVGEVIAERSRPRPPVVAPPPLAEDEEYRAQVLRRIRELAGKPVYRDDGSLQYRCGVCRDMRWLKVDVPVGHKLFGRVTMCACHAKYQQFGGQWF